MEKLDWSQCPAIESDPEKVHGVWVFRDTRMPVSLVFQYLADNATIDDIVEWHGGITPEQIKDVLRFVAAGLETPVHADSF